MSRPLRALAATVLVALGAGAAWFGRGGPNVRQMVAVDTAVAVPGAPAAPAEPGAPGEPAAGRPSTPAVLASAEPGLGARFDDLSDEELQAVIAAVEGTDRTLPSEEPAPAAPDVGGGI